MDPQEFLKVLVAAHGLPEKVEKIPGAFVHRSVVKHTAELRGMLGEVEKLSYEDQSSFIKSLALYEQTVGGLGSPTSLHPALQIVEDPNHVLFDWVLNNTVSYSYYSHGAKSFSELQQIQTAKRARAQENIEREAHREKEAKARRAKKASSNLINAIKRGDIKAVEALLQKGASTSTESNEGYSAADFAENQGHPEISQLIRGWQSGPNK